MATQERPPKKQVVLRSVPRPSRQMPLPFAMSGSSIDAARIKREQVAKRAQDEKPCRLRPKRLLGRLTPISEDCFRVSSDLFHGPV